MTAALMSLMLAAALSLFGWTMWRRYRLLAVGQPIDRFQDIPARLQWLFKVGFLQSKMFKEWKPGLMHAIIFWGFVVLGIRTTLLFARAFVPDAALPGVLNVGYSFIKDVMALGVLLMVCYALYRRWVVKPARLTMSKEAELILGLIGTLMVTDFLYDGGEFYAQVKAGTLSAEASASPIGRAVAGVFVASISEGTAHVIGTASYWLHCAVILTFLNILPRSKHFHVITSLINVFFYKTEPKGQLRGIADLEKRVEAGESVGVQQVQQATWKDMLDMYTCTECGRCEVNCPAWQTGKPLSPKKLVMAMRDQLYKREKGLLDGATETDEDKNVVAAVTEEVIWSCTTCRSCEENCPVMIEHVQKIVDMRRYLVMQEASFPKEMTKALRDLEQKSNPWGLPMNKRDEWAKALGVPHISEVPDAEYLYFVGCAGSFDDRAKKVSTALVKILREAKITFGILGKDEGCTGDPARRAGNEYLFEMQAKQNIEVMNGLNIKKVITACPHCFNTIANEYGQFGGKYEVIHHSQLIDTLVKDGRIQIDPSTGHPTTITYHDACYLGRYNDVYDAPRDTIQALGGGVNLVEMARNRQNAFCCGAGGARWLMEEKVGQRVNQTRVEQALEVKPDTIATACPYCLMMIGDGINEKGAGESVKAKDIAELVADRMKSSAPAVEA